jgi:hypothetical protein
METNTFLRNASIDRMSRHNRSPCSTSKILNRRVLSYHGKFLKRK